MKASTRSLPREHDVVAFQTGALGLETVMCGERYDVILCDLMMPARASLRPAPGAPSAPCVARRLLRRAHLKAMRAGGKATRVLAEPMRALAEPMRVLAEPMREVARAMRALAKAMRALAELGDR